MALAGLSTLGILFGYAVETTAGTKPTSFKQLTRINNIAGIELSVEQIDASTLEDFTTQYIAGRQDTGGTWTITINLTDDTITEWENLISESLTAKESGLQTWFVVYHPDMKNSFFVVAEPPRVIPVPEFGQNALQTVDINLTINRYVGMDTKIKPTTVGE